MGHERVRTRAPTRTRSESSRKRKSTMTSSAFCRFGERFRGLRHHRGNDTIRDRRTIISVDVITSSRRKTYIIGVVIYLFFLFI